MGTSILHIKTEVECKVFLFDEEKGVATIDKYFNLEVRKGEQELLFVSTSNSNLQCEKKLQIDEADSNYKLVLTSDLFFEYPDVFFELYKDAEKGDTQAQYKLGKGFCDGWITNDGKRNGEDIEKALYWLNKAASKGNKDAKEELGILYLYDKRVEKDYKKARKYYLELINMEEDSIYYDIRVNSYRKQIADTYLYECNYSEAVKWYKSVKKAVSRDDYFNDAWLKLGYLSFYGLGMPLSRSQSVEIWEKIYEELNFGYKEGRCAWNLAICYWYGIGVKKNEDKGVDWLSHAAWKAGNITVNRWDGIWNDKSGLSIELKRVGGVAAAEKNDAYAQFLLGLSYYRGDGCKEDEKKAVFWWKKAASQNEPDALFRLGRCYISGYGVDKDEHKGFELVLQSAKKNCWEAQYYVAWRYFKGDLVKKNVTECVEWFLKIIRDNNIQEKYYTINPPYYLFFDTETTGLPKYYDKPASNTNNWPRLVQLAWILTDEKGEQLSSHCMIIKPDGFSIPYAAEEVHGISTSVALQKGRPLREVITSFLEDAKLAKYFVGHNIAFDQNIVGAELHRLGINDTISAAPGICTMRETVNYCEIERTDMSYMYDDYDEMYDYDFPSLQDLYMKLFNEEFEDAHDAMADVTATMKCFFELKRMGVLSDDMAGRYNLIDDEDEDDDDILPF